MLPGNSYTFAYTYNASTGMLETYEYPSGFKLKYLYDEWGNQHEVRTADAANTLLWKANAENQRGQLTQATMGNGTITDYEWDTYGFPQRNKVSKGSTILQNLTFSFNSVTGNLNARSDAKRNNILETFDYDNLLKDRLTYWSATNGSAKTMAYASNGNVLKKSDVSTSNTGYLYETAKPNAVTKVVSPTSSFQQNAQPQSITYTSTNKVEHVLNNDVLSYQLHLTYGVDDQRVKSFLNKVTGNPSVPEVMKYYLDNYEYEYRNESYRHLHYLQGPDGLFAIMVKQGTLQTMYYVHKDYLGSLTAISDATGNLIESLSYDPWGRRRNPGNWNDYNVTSTMFDRGFTGHEHLPYFGLINMNGRVYDPFLARFLSPDPFVQAPDYSQNFNRYSYCLNNPLKYNDPSGEIIFTIAAAIFCPVLLPVAIGADIGWMTGGIRGANTEGMTFWDGAWRGGLVGVVGGGLSMIGGAGMPFVANLALGTGSGALVGGLDAALWGNDIGEGMLWGAATGAVFTTLASENFSNALKGEGFYTNKNVFNNMIERGIDKQDILSYFGFEGTYTGTTKGLSYVDGGGEGTSFYGSTNPKTGSIKYGDLAFDSYDKLKMTYNKEMYHSLRVKNGVAIETQGTELGKHLKYFPEERLGFIHAYKNQGLYPSAGKGLMSNISYYQVQSFNLNPSQYYSAKWWHFIYKIPRRW